MNIPRHQTICRLVKMVQTKLTCPFLNVLT
jgi:hypothetical protein